MESSRIAVFIVVAVTLCVAGAAVGQTVIDTQVKSGLVIGKTDHSVILKGEDGMVREFQVAPGRTAMVDGKEVGLADLKIGTTLTATFHTVAKPVVVQTTTIKDGEVVKVSGSSLVTKEKDGFHTYTIPTGFRFNVEGRGETAINDLTPGMKFSATIVRISTKMTTEVDRRKAAGAAPPEPAPAPVAAAPAPAPAPEPEPVAAAPAKKSKKLPKFEEPDEVKALKGRPRPTAQPSPWPTLAAPTAPLSVRFDAIDRILKEHSLGWSSFAFNAPESINIRATVQILALLSREKSVEDLKSAIVEAGRKEGLEVEVTDRMEARLTGLAFQITANSPEEQAILSTGTTTWKWQVKPTTIGMHHLHLTLSSVILVAGVPTRRAINTFDKKIAVEITPRQRVVDFIGENWKWLWTILIPIGGWLWARFKKKRS